MAQNALTFHKAEKEKKSKIVSVQANVYGRWTDLPFATKSGT
jgi:hypothetical protein